MTVTVGLPVYNGAKYLNDTLASLCAQSFTDFTLLISDNASTDETPDILAAWAKKDDRIKIIRQSENIGAVRNFDYVLEHAESDWFMFAANGDQWSKNYIEELYACAQKETGKDLIISKIVFRFENEQEHQIIHLPEHIFQKEHTALFRSLLKYAHGSWIYGLHRKKTLIPAYKIARDFGYVWGWDLVALIPYLLSGRVAGAPDAVFSPIISSKSADIYRPKELKDQWGIYRAFWREVCNALQDAPLTRVQKLALIPTLVRYVDRHSCKFRRIVKSAVLYPLRKG
jgi:glycosyltransferase involved in cell wall biosynthesis